MQIIKSIIDRVCLLQLPCHADKRGSLCVAQNQEHLPFDVMRCFYIYDIAPGETRGGHAHRQNEQVHICIHGQLTVAVDNGWETKEIQLDDPSIGLYVGPWVWHTMGNFRPESVLFVFNSWPYDPDEYIRDYQGFLQLVRG